MNALIVEVYIIYNQEYNILIYYSHNFAISLNQIQRYFHELNKTISIKIYNKIIQYITSLFLSKPEVIITSSSETKPILDLELIINEYIYQFNNYFQYTTTSNII